jgi:sugar-specific transcriptional regulator TrmB
MALPKNTKQDIVAILHDIGLSPSETDVFIMLLQTTAPQKVSDIAKKTRLNRTTLYGILKSLTERALISFVEERGVLRYQSIQPHLLVDYIERSKDRLAADAERVRRISPLLVAERERAARTYPTVQFFEGTEGIKQAYEEAIENNKEKTMYGFFGPDAAFNLMEFSWIDRYIARRVQKGVKSYTVATDTTGSRAFQHRDDKQLRETKLFPPGYNFEIETIAYDDKVVMTSFAEDHPFSILIEDAKIAQLFKELFRYIDSTLKN